MKKFILDLTVVENQRQNYQYVLLKLTHKDKLPLILPGQFAQIRVDGSPETFLRRPISINFVDTERNELWLLIQVVGPGTRRMAEMKIGETLNMIVPLGNSFSAPNSLDARIALIGGGVGVAPMLMFGEWIYV